MINLGGISSFSEAGLSSPLGAANAAQPRAAGDDFATVLGRLATGTAEIVQQGEAAAIAGVNGQVPLQTVVDKVMAAERALQTALAVRDKAVGAYQEISRMQI